MAAAIFNSMIQIKKNMFNASELVPRKTCEVKGYCSNGLIDANALEKPRQPLMNAGPETREMNARRRAATATRNPLAVEEAWIRSER